MNTVRTSRIAALVTVTAVVLAPRASAMDIQMFDLLKDEDQREYVEYLVDVTRKVFIELDQRDAAEKVEFLFEAIPKGTTRPRRLPDLRASASRRLEHIPQILDL